MNLENVTGFGKLALYTNDATGGVLFSGGLIVFFIIVLVLLLKYDRPFEEALTVASWSFFMVAVMFWIGGFVALAFPLFFLAVSALGTLYLFSSKP